MLFREEQDLRAGAVMTAVVEEGEGDGTPEMGDLVGVRECCDIVRHGGEEDGEVDARPAAGDLVGVGAA